MTLTRTPTGTPTPYLQAALTTDRGCLETGDNATYTVGEQADVGYEVDEIASGGMPIQVHVTIADYSNGQPVGGLDFGLQFTGMQYGFLYLVSMPTGIETLLLSADANPDPLTAQTQCSFNVVSAGCTTECDCAAGQHCEMGTCVTGGGPPYCCTSMPCPSGFDCQLPNGSYGTCPQG